MPPTVAPSVKSPKVPEFDRGGLAMASATLPDDRFALGSVIWEVLLKAHDSVKDMAFRMDQTDRSLLRRQILDGSIPLKKLLKADPKALAAFGEFLVDQFGHAKKSKQDIAREKLPELLATIIDAFAEGKGGDRG